MTTMTTELPLSTLKAQVNGKKKTLKVSKVTREREKAAKAKAAKENKPKRVVKVSTDVKAKASKPKAERAPKIAYETQEADIAKMLNVTLVETQIKGRPRKSGETKNKAVLISMPERKELVIKVNGKTVCEIYPRGAELKICTRPNFLEQVTLPDGVKANHHEAWDMTEEFKVAKAEGKNILGQFTKAHTKVSEAEKK